MKADREMIFNRNCQMELKNDHQMLALQDDKRRYMRTHAMHVKLLSLRILEESLQKIIARSRQQTLHEIEDRHIVLKTKGKGVRRMRQVVW